MADKQISALPEATEVSTSDLFVLQQSNQAKKVTGQTLVTEFAEMLDGHGGISSITLTGTLGLEKTYTITYADNTVTTFTVTDGAQGVQGQQTYVHFRWSSAYPVTTMLTTPNKYIGIYSGTSSTAPSNSSQYTWYEWKGETGDTGTSITGITKISTSGLEDTYRIAFSNNTTYDFVVKNGSNISSIAKTGTSGLLTDVYTVTLTDGTETTFNVTNAKSISSITLVSGNHSAGSTDVYRILFNDNDTFTFSVYNGANGSGSVSTVAGIAADGNGDVPLVVIQNSAPTTATVGYVNQLLYDTTGGVLYVCTAISENTYTWRGASVTVDSALSSSSTNPVQNSVIYTALQSKVNTSLTINGNALTGNITLDASDVGAVPTSRTINGNALTANIVTRLLFTSQTVATSAWVSDSTYTDYDYKAVVSLSGVTAAMIPEVVFSPDDVASGNFAPVADSGAGSVTIYAKDVPDSTITIPTIICFA